MSRGFRTTERPFEYSAWPGRYGTPTVGLVLFVVGCWMSWEISRGRINVPLTAGAIILAVVVTGGLWVGRNGTVVLPFLRCRSVNLEAVRTPSTGPRPALWLVAHLDSKSQFVPMLLRIVGVVLCFVTWVTMFVLWAVTLVAPVPASLFTITAVLSTIGAFPLAFTIVGSRGLGALDNASGVATILAAVDLLDVALPIGVLVTSAEELGLAGARAWVRGRPQAMAINCDSIDDDGQLVCMLPRTTARLLREPLKMASQAARATPSIRRILPGMLVDAIAFTEAEWLALTVSRGRWHSLARIHTRRDDLCRMTGAGIGETARFVAELAGAIIATRAGSRDDVALSGD